MLHKIAIVPIIRQHIRKYYTTIWNIMSINPVLFDKKIYEIVNKASPDIAENFAAECFAQMPDLCYNAKNERRAPLCADKKPWKNTTKP